MRRSNTEETAYQSMLQRFNKYHIVEPNSGCWIWTGPLDGVGYGILHKRVNYRSTRIGAHRFSYERFAGTIPPSMEIHHTCKTPLCVNPKHMITLTKSEHRYLEDPAKFWRDRTHCKHGHRFSAENTAIRKRGKWTERQCLTCRRIRNSHK